MPTTKRRKKDTLWKKGQVVVLLCFTICNSPIAFEVKVLKLDIVTMAKLNTLACFLLSVGAIEAFMVQEMTHPRQQTTTVLGATSDRRGFLAAAAGGATMGMGIANPAFAEQTAEYRQGIKVDAFNGLIFNYRGGGFGGLEASALNEPSVSYADFNQRLKAGEVEFVEFMAPDGDAAYVTFKAKEGDAKSSPIRIGEGYPIEQHDGYSSPMFCVRAVKNAGVPYKFTVPALAKLNY